jgi:DNA processing protein
MSTATLSPDSQAIVLLCSRLGLPKDADESIKPLSVTEWSRLAQQVADSEWERPGGLLGRSVSELRETLGLDHQLAERVVALAARGGQIAIELERLASRGIWVLTRVDEVYPEKLWARLKGNAPAVLYGAGPVELLSADGVAVVGSRDVDEAGSRFATELGKRCAEASLAIFSGVARGVDRQAMLASAEHAGTAVGVLADSLERMLRDRELADHIRGERLTLVTPFHPSAPFTVGNAMGRNKLIYCLADYAVIVASSEQNGGTWAGALENLRSRWVPLFVRIGPDVPKGNRTLVDRGGIPLAPGSPPEGADLRPWLEAAKRRVHGGSGATLPDAVGPDKDATRARSGYMQSSLFGELGHEALPHGQGGTP